MLPLALQLWSGGQTKIQALTFKKKFSIQVFPTVFDVDYSVKVIVVLYDMYEGFRHCVFGGACYK